MKRNPPVNALKITIKLFMSKQPISIKMCAFEMPIRRFGALKNDLAMLVHRGSVQCGHKCLGYNILGGEKGPRRPMNDALRMGNDEKMHRQGVNHQASPNPF
jgi:hypothetical protein